MSKFIFFFIFMTAFICKGQNTNSPAANVMRVNAKFLSDNSRKDFSFLDRIYLIAKSISQTAKIQANRDTLLVQFDLPEGANFTDSLLKVYAQAYYDALSIAMTKDSVTQKLIAIQVCNDPLHCVTAWYDPARHNYDLKLSFFQRIGLFFTTNFWHCNVTETQIYNGKKTMVICYNDIDSSYRYAQRDYIENFYQTISAVVSDYIYRNRKLRKQYQDLLVLFCCNDRLTYFWRLHISDEQLAFLYKVKFYESTRPNEYK